MTEADVQQRAMDEFARFSRDAAARWQMVYRLLREVRALEERVAELMSADLESPNDVYQRGVEASTPPLRAVGGEAP